MLLPKSITDKRNGMSMLAKMIKFISLNHVKEDWMPGNISFSFRKKKGVMIVE